MEYLGRVRDGVVVFDDGPTPEDGTVVRVEPVQDDEEPSPLAKKLLQVAGKARGLPRDLARNHDHYRHEQAGSNARPK